MHITQHAHNTHTSLHPHPPTPPRCHWPEERKRVHHRARIRREAMQGLHALVVHPQERKLVPAVQPRLLGEDALCGCVGGWGVMLLDEEERWVGR